MQITTKKLKRNKHVNRGPVVDQMRKAAWKKAGRDYKSNSNLRTIAVADLDEFATVAVVVKREVCNNVNEWVRTERLRGDALDGE